ncbi:hypothetical protein BDZ94DRAFT_1326898 [Collybia nuda]|uniref:Uncharacterized protein n=1 Tax=Collybia nuda TaxID=64659 RepID=A0A9P5XW11_9AGAR|nr:hypothetical protein BDZ94DRAFT_1326898 [Collybia nuda]
MSNNADHPMTPPPTEGASPSNLKQKRPQEEPKKNSTSGTKKKKARVSKIQQPKKQKRPSDWHLRKVEVPDGAKETKLALELHIRVLWRLSNQNAIPPKVTNDVKAPFARTVAILGLEHWAPDILSTDPDSSYNLLHEHIALTTFEQVSGAFAYSHMGINLSFIHDFSLLRKFYRSFVYAYIYVYMDHTDIICLEYHWHAPCVLMTPPLPLLQIVEFLLADTLHVDRCRVLAGSYRLPDSLRR